VAWPSSLAAMGAAASWSSLAGGDVELELPGGDGGVAELSGSDGCGSELELTGGRGRRVGAPWRTASWSSLVGTTVS
jgi:hypothetical protein